MKHARRVKMAAAALLAVPLLAGATAAAKARFTSDPAAETKAEAAYTQAHLGEAAVTKDQATDAAAAAHPGRTFDQHLQNEGTGLVWEVKVDDGSSVWEVQVDAHTGQVVSDQHDE
ncbi:hypothetical protein BH18ACT15_BH18ACT15_04600 [soil metagenome]